MPITKPECDYCVPMLKMKEIRIRTYRDNVPTPEPPWVGLEVEYVMCLEMVLCESKFTGRYKVRWPHFKEGHWSISTQDGAGVWHATGPPGTSPGPHYGLTTNAYPGSPFIVPTKADDFQPGTKLSPLVCCNPSSGWTLYRGPADQKCCTQMKDALCKCVRDKQVTEPWSVGCGKLNGGVGPIPALRGDKDHCCWETCFKITPTEIASLELDHGSGEGMGFLDDRIQNGTAAPSHIRGEINALHQQIVETFIFPHVGKGMLDLISACGYAAPSTNSDPGVFSSGPEPGVNPIGTKWEANCKCVDVTTSPKCPS